MTKEISTSDPYERLQVDVLDSKMAYVETGSGDPIVFLHGNPTSSYLWRNIIPHVEHLGRCLAPDLIGMGQSGKIPGTSMYRFEDHYCYLSAWLDVVRVTENATFVIHDWGSALAFHWAHEHREANNVRGFVYMEAMVCPVTWDEWPEAARGVFQGMRSPKGEELILERNFFVERILPASVLRGLTDEEMAVYRQPFQEEGEVRRPTLTWPREIPIEGEPADMSALVDRYAKWLETSPIPKLFVNADPGSILTGRQREYCRTWANQQEVTVKGLHFIQEDSPHEIGEAIAQFAGGGE